jgi:small subunit ribosomal protein S6
MYNYESVIIVDSQLANEQLEALVKKYSDLLTQHSAKVEKVELWGKRELAHEVDGYKYGIYLNFIYSATAEDTVPSLNSMLRIDENVIKFQTHRTGNSRKKYKVNRRYVQTQEFADA